MFSAACRNIADRRVDRRTAVFRQDDAAHAKETGQAKQSAKILRVLNLIQSQPQSARTFARIPEDFQWQWRWGFDSRRARSGAFGIASTFAAAA